ncbi:GNA1162 family protein [Hydrogenophaga sp. 2FB]|uniref:GNA1162 family protein n=1 Tax=Hydrogenophaga sp. 2FB TaxID=2502187 RepID=UPI0010F73280|nr:GNA1162 family protein [Hydrogenophaga sp. 2FB]
MSLTSTRFFSTAVLTAAALLTGCAAPKAYNYTAFKQAKPRSILVLPPVNESVDIKATYSLLSHSSKPLAEAGYYVLGSATVVEAQARLVDAQTGTLLWDGKATASSEEGRSNNNGLVGMLITAVVQQVISSATDQGHEIAGIARQRLLSVRAGNGILPGPRHLAYGQP